MHVLRKVREAGGGYEQVAAILAPDIVFNSPVLSRPVIGRDLVARVMVASVAVRDGHYVSEIKSGALTYLHWKGTIRGEAIESFEVIRDDDNGLITERTVAMRPFASLLLFRQEFRACMQDEIGADYFSVPAALAIEAT
ncbi:hypothetical protein [Rhodoferax ferrireducens]|uniref:hypothetical protein n=1 Tax=Rhodoferax ferrireducens TaxID=192843 RepID=UPI000E0D2F22|nr:hypothetical protein [Rhodoferax ferrireducens]